MIYSYLTKNHNQINDCDYIFKFFTFSISLNPICFKIFISLLYNLNKHFLIAFPGKSLFILNVKCSIINIDLEILSTVFPFFGLIKILSFYLFKILGFVLNKISNTFELWADRFLIKLIFSNQDIKIETVIL